MLGFVGLVGSGPKPMIPTIPSLSRLGRSFFPGREKRTPRTCLMRGLTGKENIWDFLGMGIGEVVMQLCFDVYITGEFASFLMSHLMQVFGESFEVGDLYKKVCMGMNFLCQWLPLVFTARWLGEMLPRIKLL